MYPTITEDIRIKVVAGKYLVPMDILPRDGRLFVKFKFNRTLIAEVKSMEAPKWHGYDEPPRKIWSIAASEHNLFRLMWLARKDTNLNWGNPYERYDKELIDLEFDRPLYDHQKEMVRHALTRQYCIFACEMGTGKTLAAIEVMERIGITDALMDVWYVGPKSGVKVIKRELLKWDSPWRPRAFTYEALVKYMLNWKSGTPPPRLLILDESSKVKTPTAQRSEAAMHVATAVRDHWGDQGYVIEMSGTPAPRVPTDWWNQCQIAQPGFLKEGNVHKFKLRMCIIEQREGGAGGTYPHIVTWLDDEKKCATCGAEAIADVHTDIENEKYHAWQKSKNEVSNLHARMKGLVLVQFKKDCLDLPDKIFEIVDIKPSVEMLRACKLVTKTSRRAIEALTRLRELSDGFQYENIPTGETEECPVCHGGGSIKVPILPDQEEFDVVDPTQPQDFSKEMVEKEVCCDSCGGNGRIKKYRRETVEVGTPKDDILIQALEDHSEVGRHIVWGGFTGTIDRIVRICHQHGWSTLRVDGRGYVGEGPQGETLDSDDLLDAMDASNPRRAVLLDAHPKLAFVGHPKAGGMALTLTMAPTMDFFSNDFSGEARMQASERHHRAGMDMNRAARIRDYIHLPSDKLVLDNLLKKKRLQDMAMGELSSVINSAMEAMRDD